MLMSTFLARLVSPSGWVLRLNALFVQAVLTASFTVIVTGLLAELIRPWVAGRSWADPDERVPVPAGSRRGRSVDGRRRAHE